MDEVKELICTILHISDTHFGAQRKLLGRQAAEFLIEDIKSYHRENSERDSAFPQLHHPDVCVVSGDLVAYGKDYNESIVFLRALADELFAGDRERILVIPGNHDVDWDISRECFREIPFGPALMQELEAGHPSGKYRKATQGDRIQVFERMDGIYQSRFSHFEEFYHEFYEGRRSFPRDGQYCFNISTVANCPGVVFVGFNSCEYVDHLSSVPSVNGEAILNASTKIESNKDLANSVRVAFWHHGLATEGRQPDFIDKDSLELLALRGGFSVLLHGHRHARVYGSVNTLVDGRIHVIGAGTVGAPKNERGDSVPYQYNLIVVANESLTVHSRKRNDCLSAWRPDFDVGGGRSPRPFVELPLRPRVERRPRGIISTSSRQQRLTMSSWSEDSDFSARNLLGKRHSEMAQEVIRKGATVGLSHAGFLFGRVLAAKHVLEQVVTWTGNRCVDGPQWIGKTALFQALCNEEFREWVNPGVNSDSGSGRPQWLYMDLRDFRRGDAAGTSLEEGIMGAIGKRIGIRLGVGGLQEVVEILKQRRERLILILDHFEDAIGKDELEESFLDQLRALEKRIGILYSMTSEKRISNISRRKAMYFEATLQIIEFLEERDAVALLRVPLRMAGVELDELGLRELLSLGGRHPFFLAIARQVFFDCWQRLGGRDQEQLREAAALEFGRIVPRIYDGLLGQLKKHRVAELERHLSGESQASLRREEIPLELQPFGYWEGARFVAFSDHFRRYFLRAYLPMYRDLGD